jgi:hypothetical protein
VRGRGVDNAGLVIFDEADRLLRRFIRQAKNDDISGIERLGARGEILAPCWVDRQEREVRSAGQTYQLRRR